MVRLEKLFPKNITIKFEETFNTNSNCKNVKKSRGPKLGKTIPPFKIF